MTLTPNQMKFLRFVAENPGCTIWALMHHLWPKNGNKEKLRRLKKDLEVRSGVSWLFETGDGWRLSKGGIRLCKELGIEVKEHAV